MTPDDIRAAIPRALETQREMRALPPIDYGQELAKMAAKAVIDNTGEELLIELLDLASTMLASHLRVEGQQRVLHAFVTQCAERAQKFEAFNAAFDTACLLDIVRRK